MSNDVSKVAPGRQSFILKLPNEIISIILEHLGYNPRQIKDIDRRSSLSLESFSSTRLPVPIDPGESNNVCNFRLVCQQFNEWGLQQQFARVSVRFNSAGFERLKLIMTQRHIRVMVKKLTYLVPRFYLGDNSYFEQLLDHERNTIQRLERDRRSLQGNGSSQIRHAIAHCRRSESRILQAKRRAEDQKSILANEVDAETIRSAFVGFTNLEQVRLLRLEDNVDRDWISFLRTHEGDWSHFSWPHAFEYALHTLAMAYWQSNSKVKRFSCRFMDPCQRVGLTAQSRNILSRIASHLDSFEVELVDDQVLPHRGGDLNGRAIQLSALSMEILSRTTSHLRGLHFGYQQRVSVPLETIFHNLVWEKLVYIGIHRWCLLDHEIIAFLRRHSKIRCLRMRYIMLRDGSRWDRVLKVIRRELTALKWVSLLGIGYAQPDDRSIYIQDDSDFDSDIMLHLEEDDDEDNDDDDSDDGEDDDQSDSAQSSTGTERVAYSDHTSDFAESDNDFSESSEANIAGEEQHGDESSSNPNARSWCYCNSGNGLAWGDLDDNGEVVERAQWKKWEIWAIKRCSLHDPRGDGEE
ncbi:hypothetical protein B0J14DRAFT_493235 [Halenospora varia]|nr:hypothetical protein B0J14DRAFT_493235 [Halenospora varia]